MDRWSQFERCHLERRHHPDVAGLDGLPLAEALLAAHEYQVVRYPSAHPLLGGAWAALFPDIGVAACDVGLARNGDGIAGARGGSSAAAWRSVDCESLDFDPEADPSDAGSGALETYNPRQQRELEANVFALQLLLPREQLWRLFVEDKLDASAIARRLGVSFTATLNALAGLLRGEEAAPAEGETPPRAVALDPSASGSPRPSRDDRHWCRPVQERAKRAP